MSVPPEAPQSTVKSTDDLHSSSQPSSQQVAQKSLRLNTLIIMLGTLASRLSGIVRQILINMFGDVLTDAFAVAIRIPNLLRELLAEGALVNSFIPVYKSLDRAQQKQFAAAFSGVLIALNLILTALGILLAPMFVDLLISAQANVDRHIAVYMTQLVMPFLMLISLSSIAMGLLNADEHFKESSFAPVAFNLASIVVLLFAPKTATMLALGWMIGGSFQLLVQLPALHRLGLLPQPNLGWHPAMGRVFRQMAPFTLTAGARQFLNLYVTRMLTNAQQFPQGTQTGYSNAEALFTMANGIFVVSPVLALFPRFSQYAAKKEWREFRALTMQGLRTTTFLAAPVSAIMFALAPYAVSLFFISEPSATRFAAGAGILSGWALALVPWAMVTILLRTFYARERTLQAVIVSTIGFLLEVGLYQILVPKVDFIGFGLSTTLSGLIMTLALIIMYRRDLGFYSREMSIHLIKVCGMAALSGVAAWLVVSRLPDPGVFWTGVLGLSVGGLIGVSVYFTLSSMLGIPEIAALTRRFGRSNT